MGMTPQQKRRFITTAAITLIGASCSVIAYLTARETARTAFEDFEQSKKFANEVERMGGKMSLIANDLGSWFAGLWQGQNVSYTIAVGTVIIALTYYLVASALDAEKALKAQRPDVPTEP